MPMLTNIEEVYDLAIPNHHLNAPKIVRYTATIMGVNSNND